MTVSRAVLALMITASAALPYAAPALCAALRPDLAGPHAAAMHHGPQVTDGASPGTHCNFADCATAPVAPVATLGVAGIVIPVVDVALSFPAAGPDIDPAAPLTPPPIA